MSQRMQQDVANISWRLPNILGLLLLPILLNCGGGGSGGGGGSSVPPADTSYLSAPGATRTWLTDSDLTSAKAAPNSPLHNNYFMPVGTSNPALHPFSGTIHLTSFMVSTNDPSPGNGYVDTTFPNIDLEFVSDGNDLIPLKREILTGTNSSSMRLILEPGSIWSEPTDNGWSRASFPFELTGGWNFSLNGIATFIYTDTKISALRLQTVQDTNGGGGARTNIWGILNATYVPLLFADNLGVVAQFHQEKAGYLPVASWSDLASQLKMDVGAFNGGINTQQISTTGVVKDGVIYRQPCYTRFGDYPYCQQMRSGAFSTSKSMVAAVALLRLAQKYGDGVGDLLIKNYLNVNATHNGWDNVTFLDTLDMATGIGTTNANVPVGTGSYTFGDEGNDISDTMFFDTQGTANMLNVAFTQPKYSWGPGVEMRYDSMHTFILSAAMDAYLKQQEGPNANIGDMLVNEVYAPIGIAHAPLMRTTESNGTEGIPFMAYGLYPTADDTAKLAQLLQNGGSHNGQQILSASLLQTALYQTTNQGLRGYSGYDNVYGQSRYLMSFWSLPWSDGANCTARVPYMNGAGGNLIALLPNGVTVFRYSDSNNYDATPLIQAGANLGNMCH